MRKAIIVHGWAYNPKMNWYQHLRKELEAKGFQVEVPEMPNSEHPKITDWVNKLKEIILELYGEELGNKILTKLNAQMNAKKFFSYYYSI
jgi:predicted alpha/beta hydrolase family esterase